MPETASGRSSAEALLNAAKPAKKYSQKRWLELPENRDYFRGPYHMFSALEIGE